MDNIKLTNEIAEIIEVLKKNGFEAYIVGGYVRDLLLGKNSFDVDVTTNATPTQLKNVLKDYKIDDNFSDLGSIKFKCGKYNFEITTYRREYDYKQHRKPGKITFVSALEEDLYRRDFTMNSVCFDGEKIIDLFNGIDDINNKKIKTIGDSSTRFAEDALRILRAFRFASKLGFDLDITDSAIYENCKYLDCISFDSKYKELKGILKGSNYLKILKKYKEVFVSAFKLEKLEINYFSDDMDYEKKEALFFYFSDKKIKNKYLINKNIVFKKEKIDLKYKLKQYGEEAIWDLLSFKSSVLKENVDELEMLKCIIDNNECYNLRMLDIKGEDLLNIGIESNRIGKHLEKLLDAVIVGKCINNKNELLKYLTKNILD